MCWLHVVVKHYITSCCHEYNKHLKAVDSHNPNIVYSLVTTVPRYTWEYIAHMHSMVSRMKQNQNARQKVDLSILEKVIECTGDFGGHSHSTVLNTHIFCIKHQNPQSKCTLYTVLWCYADAMNQLRLLSG